MRLFVPGRQAHFYMEKCRAAAPPRRTKGRKAMKKMTSGELRNMWLNFFKSKGHAVIPSASVIP